MKLKENLKREQIKIIDLTVDVGVGAAERTNNSKDIPCDPIWKVKREKNNRKTKNKEKYVK